MSSRPEEAGLAPRIMKYLFLLIAVLLAAASVFVWADMPGSLSGRRAFIYWTTDPNPARYEQVRLFDEYQKRIGLVDEEGEPMIGLELDTGNAEVTKKIVQSVSGVAGDAMDLNGGRDLRFFQAMGVLEDVTDEAEKLGFGVGTTYPAIEAEISLVGPDGQRRQYTYPCNVAFTMYMANAALFRELGMDPPPTRWTVDEFERVGREFVRRANDNSGRPARVFFVDAVNDTILARGFGVDQFNETLTDVNFEHPDYVRAIELVRRWTYDLRLVPSGADREAFATAGGYGGAGQQVFEQEYYGLFNGGRWNLIRFRQANVDRVAKGEEPFELTTCEPPHGGHPNIMIGTRAAAVYLDGEALDEDVTLADGTVVEEGTPWAVFFQAFLASPEYGDQIIADADGLPGNPALTDSEAYRRPAEDPGVGHLRQDRVRHPRPRTWRRRGRSPTPTATARSS